MPITWCYEVADSLKKYCSTGFPIGCAVTDAGQPKDACVIDVSILIIVKKVYDNTLDSISVM